MLQPPGFKDSKLPNYVCKLNKSLYGLKQAPRAWFERFTSYLLTLGFVASTADSSLFVHVHGTSFTYLLLYVDDILTGSDPKYIAALKGIFGLEFQLTDLGSLKYFLGLEIQHSSNGFYVTQTKYLADLLIKTGMNDLKPCNTPMSSTNDLHTASKPYCDPL